jgi:hypothetical protein
MFSHIEIINKEGKGIKYQNVKDVLDILADANQIKEMQIHVISIVRIVADDSNKQCSNWYLKTINDEWYQESEARIKSLSSEYCEMVNNQDINRIVWVQRDYKCDAMKDLDFKMQTTREIDIHQYRRLFECNCIQQVISHEEMVYCLERIQ